MLNKLLVRINNINELSYLKEKGINNFLFPLDGFSIGYNTFKIEQIKDLDVNIYLLVNRVFDNDTLNNWNNIKEKLTFAKGIFFEDIAVYMTTKNIPLIWNTSHAVISTNSINYWLSLVDSACLSNELTKEEIINIINNVNKEIVLPIYGKNMAMYSRRNLISNYEKHKGITLNDHNLTPDNKITFKEVENFYGTVFFADTPFNYINILKDINNAKIKLYYFDLAGITPEEMFEILNGKEVSCDNRFLEHKTIYKLEAKKWLNYYHQQVTKKKCV